MSCKIPSLPVLSNASYCTQLSVLGSNPTVRLGTWCLTLPFRSLALVFQVRFWVWMQIYHKWKPRKSEHVLICAGPWVRAISKPEGSPSEWRQSCWCGCLTLENGHMNTSQNTGIMEILYLLMCLCSLHCCQVPSSSSHPTTSVGF